MLINEGSCNVCVYSATKCALERHFRRQGHERGLVLDFYMILYVFSFITIWKFPMIKKWKYDRAIVRFSKAIKLNPDDYIAYKNRGNAYYKKKLYDLAIADYNKAIKLNPGFVVAYNNRGIVYQEIGQCDLAIADYNKAIELNPKNGMPYNNRGFTLLLMGRLEEAERDIRKSLELNASNIYALNSMAELYAAKNDPIEACKWLKEAIKKGYNNWPYIKTSGTYNNIRNSSCFKEIISGKK
jgi:tetratricopeptide (TPR) repeat protein